MGHMDCCEKTGYVTIADSTGNVPLISIMLPQQQSSAHSPLNLDPLNAVTMGSTVVLSGVTVYVEKMSPGFLQNDSNPASHVIYISATLCTPIASTAAVRQRESSKTNRPLYFHVINKNCVVVRPSGLMFSAHSVIGESLETLKEKREEDKKDGREPVAEVALSFTEKAFKWYSYVVNGGTYSLNSSEKLSSISELSDIGFLQVTSDMKLQRIDYSSPQQIMYDTTDLIDTATLPGFIRHKDTHQRKRCSIFLLQKSSMCLSCNCD